MRHPSTLPPFVALVVAVGLLLPACAGRRQMEPPPCFAPDAPILTGDANLDRRIAEAQRAARLSDDDIQRTIKKMEAGRGTVDELAEVVRAFLGRGNVAAALEMVNRWVEWTRYSDPAMATYLDLAFGTEHYEDGLNAIDRYLTVHEDDPYLVLTRGVLLRRFGRPRIALDSFVTALQGISSLAGLSGILEREVGLDDLGIAIDEHILLNERLQLIETMGSRSIVGRVAVRHLVGIDEETLPPDPRLLDLGGVRTEEVDAVFASRREAFRHCQLMYAKGRKIPGGHLVLHVKIAADGSPSAIKRVRDTFDVQEVAACLEEQTSHLWFPQPRYGRPVLYERDFRMTAY